MKNAVKAAGLEECVEVVGVGCMGFCRPCPLVKIEPDDIIYEEVEPENAASIIDALNGGQTEVTKGDSQHPFFSDQLRIIRENTGKINPERIEEYIAVGGYQSLYNAIHEMTPSEVVEEITRSGLRGCGGGGDPTGLKWATVAKMPEGQKYIICNDDEGDPGAFMDRSVLESYPHLV